MKSRKGWSGLVCVCAATFALSGSLARAGMIVTFGQGSAVTQLASGTYFNGIGGSLAPYVQNGVSVFQAGGVAYEGFDPTWGNGGFLGDFYYASGGTYTPTVISFGGTAMYAVEMAVGNGFGQLADYIAFKTADGGGTFQVSAGGVVGFTDVNGFTSLEIGAYNGLVAATGALGSNFTTSTNAIALDSLLVQTAPTDATPEPGSFVLLAAGLALIGGVRRTGSLTR